MRYFNITRPIKNGRISVDPYFDIFGIESIVRLRWFGILNTFDILGLGCKLAVRLCKDKIVGLYAFESGGVMLLVCV